MMEICGVGFDLNRLPLTINDWSFRMRIYIWHYKMDNNHNTSNFICYGWAFRLSRFRIAFFFSFFVFILMKRSGGRRHRRRRSFSQLNRYSFSSMSFTSHRCRSSDAMRTTSSMIRGKKIIKYSNSYLGAQSIREECQTPSTFAASKLIKNRKCARVRSQSRQ